MITDALRKGASVRLVGDDGQLSSISAGGVLRDIAEATDALTLSEVVRFRSAAEAAAGLALHDADPAGIGFYIDNHRVHVGTDDTAADMAYHAWRADLAAGADSILLAPTNDVINALNARARTDRLAADPAAAGARTVVLADQLTASAGDTIRTRKNARWIPIGRTDFVRNGYRYTITEVMPDGSLKARHLRSGRIVTLPADYIAEHVTLGYAATIDSAQGLTAGRRDIKGSCHIVGSDMLTRQALYVAMTRATDENHLYLSTAEGDPHRLLSPKATHPDTAVDVLTRALARDGAQVSATTAARQAADPAARLAAAADMYYDALGAAAENRLGVGARDRLDVIADEVIPALSTREAWPVLRRNLAVLALSGADPHQLLVDALAKGSVDDAADPAAVLDYRIDPAGAHSSGVGVLRWLPAIPAALADDPQWGDYLARREHLVDTLADAIRERAQGWTNATAPAWARPLITVNRALTAEIAVFRAAVGVEEADTRLTGPRQFPVRTRAVQALLQRHAAAGIGRRSADTTRWNDVIDAIDPRLRSDAYWPQLAAHLAQATRTTPDLRQIITHRRPPRAPARRTTRSGAVVAHRRRALTDRHAGHHALAATPSLDHRRRRSVRISAGRNHHLRPRLARIGRRHQRRRPPQVDTARPAQRRRRTPRRRQRRQRPHPARRLRPTDHLHRRRVHPPPTGPSRRGLRRHPHPRGRGRAARSRRGTSASPRPRRHLPNHRRARRTRRLLRWRPAGSAHIRISAGRNSTGCNSKSCQQTALHPNWASPWKSSPPCATNIEPSAKKSPHSTPIFAPEMAPPCALPPRNYCACATRSMPTAPTVTPSPRSWSSGPTPTPTTTTSCA